VVQIGSGWLEVGGARPSSFDNAGLVLETYVHTYICNHTLSRTYGMRRGEARRGRRCEVRCGQVPYRFSLSQAIISLPRLCASPS
jgi:hypothetical protein